MTVVDAPPSVPVTRGGARRLVVVVADQGVNSVTNVVVVLLVAASVPLAQFGLFATAAVAIQLGETIGIAAMGDRLLQAAPDGRAARFATGNHVLRLALGVGLVVAAVGLLLLGPSPWVVMIALLPTLAGIDYWRIHTIARGRAPVALVLDVVFGLSQIATVVGWRLAGTPGGSGGAMAAWTLSALLVTALMAAPWFRERDRVARADREPVAVAVSLRYGVEMAVVNGSGQIAQLLVTLQLGLAFSGALRAAQVPFGVMIVLVASVRAVLIPRMAAAPAPRARRIAAVSAGVLVAVCAALTAVTIALALIGPLRFLVGGVHLQPLFVIALGAGYAAIAAATVQTYYLRARGRDREVTAGRIAMLVVLALGTLIAAMTRSPWGFLVALAASWLTSSVVMLRARPSRADRSPLEMPDADPAVTV